MVKCSTHFNDKIFSELSIIKQLRSAYTFGLIYQMQSEHKQILKYIQASLWGAVLGDVIGAYLEFTPAITPEKISQAFLIKGGGMHKLEPGQPTDDSQLAYAVAKGLIRGKGQLNLNYIAQEMGNWYSSRPIDVGGTIKNAVPKACGMKQHQAHLVRKGARQKSQKSQSNGSLMAITPMSIWCYRLEPKQVIRAIRQYTILVHPNQLVILVNTFYTLILCYLLNHNSEEKKRINSYLFAKETMQEEISKKQCKQQFQEWLHLIQQSFENPSILHEKLPANKAAGWVRIAFSYSIMLLIKAKPYRQSIEELLGEKGDTDTNSCIAGGLIGASFLRSQLNMEQQIQKIDKWRPNKAKRPNWMVPGLVVEDITKKIHEIAPKQLKVIGGVQNSETVGKS